jgi:hypothetical protein
MTFLCFMFFSFTENIRNATMQSPNDKNQVKIEGCYIAVFSNLVIRLQMTHFNIFGSEITFVAQLFPEFRHLPKFDILF